VENPSARHLQHIKLTGNFPLNENIFGEDKFLSPHVTDRPYCQATEPASAPSSSKDNNEEKTSAGFVTLF
jgi:hypothetical protein